MKTLQSRDNLVWIDLEMTGLDPDKEKIIEIATLITDSSLNIIAEGPNLIISQPKEILKSMDEWNQNQHGSSGLTDEVLKSNVTEQIAEIETLDFISKYVASSRFNLQQPIQAEAHDTLLQFIVYVPFSSSIKVDRHNRHASFCSLFFIMKFNKAFCSCHFIKFK